jgi:hypothetical protein
LSAPTRLEKRIKSSRVKESFIGKFDSFNKFNYPNERFVENILQEKERN